MIQIKKTKSVEMWGDKSEVVIQCWGDAQLHIPIKSVFQVKRGLESYTQKFYRRKVK
jgi:hypothetical protein